MEWTITKSDRTSEDPSGVDGFVQRMDKELRAGGSPIEGFRILESGLEMLWITREIENEVLQNPEENNRLYVGFQNSTKLNIENRRYEILKKAGIDVVGFGEGGTSEENSKNLEQWVALPRNTSAFENQWYLITTGPSPIVFIGWETSDPEKFGDGGISSEGKQFRGFVSNDMRVVEAAIQQLERVRRQHLPTEPMDLNEISSYLEFPVDKIIVLTDDGKDKQISEVRQNLIPFAKCQTAALILYDISAASYLVNPYPNAQTVEELNRPLSTKDLALLGRQYLIDQINQLDQEGVCAGAILPTGHGFATLGSWAEQEKIDLVVIPEQMVQPGLFDRIKGYTLNKLLDHTKVPVLISKGDGKYSIQSQVHPKKGAAVG
ncbi:MAG: universal stress protein [Chloroflexota bacterium]|nr:universal stress protein [Chloroflexota bacterium]